MISSLFTNCLTPSLTFFIWNRIFVLVFKNLEIIISKKNEYTWVLGLKFNPPKPEQRGHTTDGGNNGYG